MKQIPFSSFRKYVLLITLLFLSGGIGYQLGIHGVGVTVSRSGIVFNSTTPADVPVDFAVFWDVWNKVHRNYIDAKSIENQKMVWGAVSGMVAAIDDPHTSFFPPKENEEFKKELMGGQFEGIGAQLDRKDNRIIVITPLKGSPAEKAGIKAGDYIIKVNDQDTLNWSVQQAVNTIRGPKGSSVVLTVVHPDADKSVEITITRDTITVAAVDSWIKKPSEVVQIQELIPAKIKSGTQKVAYLHLSRFGDRLNIEWPKAVDEILFGIKAGDVAGMILDLRANPGGYLDGSVYLAGEFLPSGTLVVSQKNSDGTKEDYTVNRPGRLLNTPLVVLIDKGSASASEIVAGALKDHKRAVIIGETSFGKGSVQTPFDVSGGSSVHITTGIWLTPSGESIMKKGIIPDIEISSDDSVATRDAQLAKAVAEILK